MPQIRYFAGAADAAGTASETVDATTLGALREAVVTAHGPAFASVLSRCSLLVDGENNTADDTPLTPTTVVDILPPFAGG